MLKEINLFKKKNIGGEMNTKFALFANVKLM